MNRRWTSVPVLVVVAAALLTGCGGDPAPKPTTAAPALTSATPTDTESAPAAEDPAASLPPGAQAGLDDYDGDGTPDPTCTTQDFGAGLVLRIPCQIISANDLSEGTRLVKDSLFRLPGPQVDMTEVSGSALVARTPEGGRVYIIVFNTDGLFATGSDAINSAATLDATIKLINQQWPNGAVQVRGHTDATGTASANQALSERRARNVTTYLTGHGLQASGVTTAGLGSTRPIVEEDTVQGRAFNRRVEVVIRLAK